MNTQTKTQGVRNRVPLCFGEDDWLAEESQCLRCCENVWNFEYQIIYTSYPYSTDKANRAFDHELMALYDSVQVSI